MLFLSASCFQGIIDGEGHHTDLVVSNQSDYDIYVYKYYYDTLYFFSIYRSPSGPFRKNTVEKYRFSIYNWTFEDYFQDKSTMFFYIIEASYAEAHEGEKNYLPRLRKYALIAKYKLTLDDLESLDWSISFPPDEKMRGMDIFIYLRWRHLAPDWYLEDLYNEREAYTFPSQPEPILFSQ